MITGVPLERSLVGIARGIELPVPVQRLREHTRSFAIVRLCDQMPTKHADRCSELAARPKRSRLVQCTALRPEHAGLKADHDQRDGTDEAAGPRTAHQMGGIW